MTYIIIILMAVIAVGVLLSSDRGVTMLKGFGGVGVSIIKAIPSIFMLCLLVWLMIYLYPITPRLVSFIFITSSIILLAYIVDIFWPFMKH